MILVEETDTRFYIEKSTIPHAGMGVFAAQSIRQDDFLEIIGIQVKCDSLTDQCTEFAKDYKFAARKKDYDRLIVPLGLGGMVNHAPTTDEQNVEIRYMPNSKKNANASGAVYYFLRDVDKDEEVLGDYGPQWKDTLEWAGKAASVADELQDDWTAFLEHDLYNLGMLKRVGVNKE